MFSLTHDHDQHDSHSSSTSRPFRTSAAAALHRISLQSAQEERRDQREKIIDKLIKQNKVKYKYDNMDDEDDHIDADGDSHMHPSCSSEVAMEDEYSEEEEQDHDHEESEKKKQDESINWEESTNLNLKKRHLAESSAAPYDSNKKPKPAADEDILDDDEEWGTTTGGRKRSWEYKQALLHRNQLTQANRRIARSACFDRIDAAKTEEERIEAIINEIFLPKEQQPEKTAKGRLLVPGLKTKLNLQSPRTGLTLLMCFIEVTRLTDKYDYWYWKPLLLYCNKSNLNFTLTNHWGETLLQFLLASNKWHSPSNPMALNEFEKKLFSKLLPSDINLLFQQSPTGSYPIECLVRTRTHSDYWCDSERLLKTLCSQRYVHLTSMKLDKLGNTWLHWYLQDYASKESLYWCDPLLRLLDNQVWLFESIDFASTNTKGESLYQLLIKANDKAYTKFVVERRKQQIEDARYQAVYGRLPSRSESSHMAFCPRLQNAMLEYEAKMLPQINDLLNQHMINDLSQICLSMMVGTPLHQRYLQSLKQSVNGASITGVNSPD